MALSKNQKRAMLILVCTVLVTLAVNSLLVAAAVYVWTGQVAVSKPTARTDSFTVSATVNGTAAANPNTINLPTPLFTGDVYVINYTVTSTANQAIRVQESGGATSDSVWSWSNTLLLLPVPGNSGVMSLTITIGTTVGTINVQFMASP